MATRAAIMASVAAVLAGCGGGNPVGQAPIPPQTAYTPPTATPVVPPPPVAAVPAPAPCFKLSEALVYSGTPDLSLYGMSHVTVVDPGHQEYGVLNTDAKETVVMDWELAGKPLPEAFTWARQSGYKGPLSFYMMLPKRDYWRAVAGPNSAPYKQWQAENDALKPTVASVAAIYPSLYTFYTDQTAWVAYATANMAEGRRIAPAKKMYPFLWPSNHTTGVDLPADYWLKELRTVRDHADGAVIWGGWDVDHARPWDQNAAWWKATQEFIAETNICK
jgi:hypothetical protein